MTSGLDRVLRDIADERARQDAKWGEQHHPDGTGAAYGLRDHPVLDVKTAQHRCDQAFEQGTGTWEHILFEEFAEAMAEDDPVRLRAELVQLAAVAAHWIEDIDSRRQSG